MFLCFYASVHFTDPRGTWLIKRQTKNSICNCAKLQLSVSAKCANIS